MKGFKWVLNEDGTYDKIAVKYIGFENEKKDDDDRESGS
jgi:hypothetical protein